MIHNQQIDGFLSLFDSDDLGFKDDHIPKISNHEADLRRRDKSYQDILQSHDLLQNRVRSSRRKLKLARLQILRFCFINDLIHFNFEVELGLSLGFCF